MKKALSLIATVALSFGAFTAQADGGAMYNSLGCVDAMVLMVLVLLDLN